MSKNRKYIEQFDRNAGKPAEFDSLFRFEKDKLIAKRKIKVNSSHSRFALMCSSAAVIGIAAFAALAYINSQGIASDTVMSKSTGAASTELTEYSDMSSLSELLSEMTDRFEYEISGDSSTVTNALPNYLSETETQSDTAADPQVIIRFSVASKQYSAGEIIYTLNPVGYYTVKDALQSVYGADNGIISFSVPAYSDVRELQIGREYIMPFSVINGINDDSENIKAVIFCDNTGYYAQKTDKGWLIYCCGTYRSAFFEKLAEDTEEVCDDIFGNGSYYLEPSDEKMIDKIKEYAENTDTLYYSIDLESSTACTELDNILPNAEFEKVRYAVDENGETDKTLIVLDNEQYFSVMPHIFGNVIFAGTSLNGSLCAAVELANYGQSEDEYICRTVLMSGFTELNVSTGDSTDDNTVIGVCGTEPIYMQFIDNNGMPMEINIGTTENAD